jgi:hypothetical protein
MPAGGGVPKAEDAHEPAGAQDPDGAREADEEHEEAGVAGSQDAADLPKGTTAGALARRIVQRLGWGGRVDLFISREDARSWFPDDPPDLPESDAAAVAYFIDQKGWPADASGAPDPGRQATRGDLARMPLPRRRDRASCSRST